MGENKWSSQRKAKKKLQREMQAYYEKEYLQDEEERESNGKR